MLNPPHAPAQLDSVPADNEAKVRATELLISNLLRFGVIVSLLVIVAGTVLSFVHHPQYISSPQELQRLTQPGAAFPHTVADVTAGARAGRGQAIVTLGLFLLIATPVLRVAVSVVAFIYQGDRVFVGITLGVLCLLLLSFLLGKAGG